MAAISHDLASLLEETAQITDRAFVVLQVETDYGSDLIAEAFVGLSGYDADVLETGPLIMSCDDDAQGRDTFNRIVDTAVQAFHGNPGDVDMPIASTITFVGRANEGEASRTGVMKLVANVGRGYADSDRPRFLGTGHIRMPRAGFRVGR